MNKIYKIICAVFALIAIVICIYVLVISFIMNFTTTKNIVWTVTILAVAFGILSMLKKHFKSTRKNKYQDAVFDIMFWLPVVVLIIYFIRYIMRVYL